MFNAFLKDESGATAIEYALIAALLAIGIIAAVTALRNELNTTFNTVTTNLQAGNSNTN